MAKSTFPTDRFDDIPDDLQRVGAHRARNVRHRRWIGFAYAALATGILVTAGVVGLSLLTGTGAPTPQSGGGATGPSASPTASATSGAEVPGAVVPKLDAAVLITVLNGTAKPGLAVAAGDGLVKKGWGGAAIGVGTRASADVKNVTATIVYYTTASSEAAALKLVSDLGVGRAELSSAYQTTPITVLLGSDFVPPAA